MSKQIFFSYDDYAMTAEELKKLQQQLMPTITYLATYNKGYTTEYAPLAVPFDTTMHTEVEQLISRKKSLQPAMLIVIGIGGSNLGTSAIVQALQGVGRTTSKMSFYCADSVDPDVTAALYAQAEEVLQSGQTVMLVIISKSGTTTETIANAQLFTALLSRYIKNYQDFMVIISDEGSPLWTIAHKQGIACLAIPSKVGGRFSVFSPVGLFPLGMLDIDIRALVAGVASVQSLIKTFDRNPAALSAAILYAAYQRGITIHDSFFFIAQAEGIGRWYRQLLAESIGKMYDRDGKVVSVGITPTVSIGSVDLHSMAQLYLAGPQQRITTFISVKQESSIRVPSTTIFDTLMPALHHKSFRMLMAALQGGIQKAYQQQQLPFMSIELPEISAYYIGQLMQCKMIEIMYLGALFTINPFDQPQVELYKEETRKILAHE